MCRALIHMCAQAPNDPTDASESEVHDKERARLFHFTKPAMTSLAQTSADDDYALTERILHQCPASTPGASSWVHGGCEVRRPSWRRTTGSLSDSQLSLQGDTGRARRRDRGRGWLPAGSDCRVWCVSGGTGGCRRQFVTWRLQHHHSTQASRADGRKTEPGQRKLIQILPRHCACLKKIKMQRVAVASSESSQAACAGSVPRRPTWERSPRLQVHGPWGPPDPRQARPAVAGSGLQHTASREGPEHLQGFHAAPENKSPSRALRPTFLQGLRHH